MMSYAGMPLHTFTPAHSISHSPSVKLEISCRVAVCASGEAVSAPRRPPPRPSPALQGRGNGTWSQARCWIRDPARVVGGSRRPRNRAERRQGGPPSNDRTIRWRTVISSISPIRGSPVCSLLPLLGLTSPSAVLQLQHGRASSSERFMQEQQLASAGPTLRTAG
jgi:hypothetical protein